MMCNCRRHTIAFFVVLATLPLPAFAAKRITIEQLQQTLAAGQASHRSDDATAQQLQEMELSVRLSTPLLRQMIAANPGPKTLEALRNLAGASVFLPPPPNEIPSRPPPDVAAQKAMLAQTIQYVSRTLPTLPDFLATRRTEHFDDSPHPLAADDWPTRNGFHYRGSMEAPIAFRDGRETDDPSAVETSVSKKPDRSKTIKPASLSSLGLVSWGEFGPILGLVLVDAARGKLSWARWEQSNSKVAAVFQFSIDHSVSHYTVQYWRNGDAEVVGSSYGARNGQGASKGQTISSGPRLLRQATGYHGTLAVDPETGTVLRITIEADLGPSDPIQRGAIMVEYGPVRIGEKTYTCPTRSVTLSLSHAPWQPSPIAPRIDILELQRNDISFLNYRRFGSEATLITGSSPSSPSLSQPGDEMPREMASAASETAAEP